MNGIEALEETEHESIGHLTPKLKNTYKSLCNQYGQDFYVTYEPARGIDEGLIIFFIHRKNGRLDSYRYYDYAGKLRRIHGAR